MINVKLPLYIKEFSYNGKTLKDVLILDKERLESILRDKTYGEVFYEYLKNYKKEEESTKDFKEKQEVKTETVTQTKKESVIAEEYPLFRKKLP